MITDNGTIARWAEQLGLALSPLFARAAGSEECAHFALLNGRDASFACSSSIDVDPETSRSWQWSADLAHHVIVDTNDVLVRSGREHTRRFTRKSIEVQLEEFLGYLDAQRQGALPDIVRFLLGELEQIWALLPSATDKGHVALAAFLVGLEAAENPEAFRDKQWRRASGEALGLLADQVDALDTLPEAVISRAVSLPGRTPLRLSLEPGLVLRHAGGRLFQEAHGYLESVQTDMFNDAKVSRVATFSPTGAYFTPLPIARLVAESAIQQLDALPDKLVIADFSCGSAVFLTEALYALERFGYKGRVRLVGRDISPEAIVMAQVAVAAACRGITGINVEVDIHQQDSLHDDVWATADIVLMNPPFRSWERMNSFERQWVRRAIGGTPKGRPDLSVGFVEHALKALSPKGVLATLIPAGVLASEALASWRQQLSERYQPALVAVLGEHGLFRHALINVGILVLAHDRRAAEAPMTVAWASPESGAAAGALRALRKSVLGWDNGRVHSPKVAWSIAQTTVASWQRRPSWLPSPGILSAMLEMIEASSGTRTEDLFHIRQGIRTGMVEVFVLSAEQYNSLPESELRYFAPAIDNASFVNGEIRPSKYVFVGDAEWLTEQEVKSHLPMYYADRLLPSAPALRNRKGIDPERWWRLTRPRSWMFDGNSRLVSKRFGLAPAFARDFSGKLAVLQANAWLPKERLTRGLDRAQVQDLLTSYWWLLNSGIAVLLFREFCPNVAGGQFDLENKYVRHVPLPNLAQRLTEDVSLQALNEDIGQRFRDVLPPKDRLDEFAAAAFGTSPGDWPLLS